MGIFSEMHFGFEATRLEAILQKAMELDNQEVSRFCRETILPLYRDAVSESNGHAISNMDVIKYFSNEMKSSSEWYEQMRSVMKITILDPDGWDRMNFAYSFNEELITKEEFKMRLSSSTISADVSTMLNDFDNW